MLWELLRYPSGDAHAQLYWRRRMSVLAVLSVILLLVLVLAFRGGGPDTSPASAEVSATTENAAAAPAGAPAPPPPAPAASPSATPSPSASPSPKASPSASASPQDAATDCPAGSMALRVSSDATAYTDGRQPVLTLSVVDIGSTPCTVDLGTRSTSISVLAMGKAIWTSNACVPKQERPTPLSPAAAQMLQLRWDLTRNAEGCEKASAPTAPGQYEVVARVGNTATYGGGFEIR